MNPSVKKLVATFLILANIALVIIWAINGYEDTWFYVSLLLISFVSSWTYFAKK